MPNYPVIWKHAKAYIVKKQKKKKNCHVVDNEFAMAIELKVTMALKNKFAMDINLAMAKQSKFPCLRNLILPWI